MDTRLQKVFDKSFRENYIHPFLSNNLSESLA